MSLRIQIYMAVFMYGSCLLSLISLIGGCGCFEMKRTVERMAQVTRQIVQSANAPAAIGPYSQAVRVDNTIYISGSLGLDPKTGELKEGIKEQTHQSLKNIGEILKAAGVGYANVVKTTVLLANINDFANVNDIYKEYFTSKFPARAAYQVAVLPKHALVEIEAIAVMGEIRDI
ncbi:putative endoribonuclease L-PSP [Dictyocaulus viviparus]|uniref:Putative endoribonuclease L-PSP n=1 Tax=Dictyocaulus viviparus TaxID=29172 RepID=A0A0D8XGX7_DICVI|nr:putative endoribonuclease L-PSP [Dictyocaulus viviparus]